MRSPTPMRAAKISCVVMALVMAGLGLLLIVGPGFNVSVLGVLCGVMLILSGAAKLAGYFSKDLYRLAFQHDLLLGILLIVLGTAALLHPGRFENLLGAAIGLVVLADGILKMQVAGDARRFGLPRWWLILGLAILAALCGVALLLRPGTGGRVLSVLLGAALLSDGVLSLGTVLTAVKIIRHQRPDVIELDNYTCESEE